MQPALNYLNGVGYFELKTHHSTHHPLVLILCRLNGHQSLCCRNINATSGRFDGKRFKIAFGSVRMSRSTRMNFGAWIKFKLVGQPFEILAVMVTRPGEW